MVPVWGKLLLNSNLFFSFWHHDVIEMYVLFMAVSHFFSFQNKQFLASVCNKMLYWHKQVVFIHDYWNVCDYLLFLWFFIIRISHIMLILCKWCLKKVLVYVKLNEKKYVVTKLGRYFGLTMHLVAKLPYIKIKSCMAWKRVWPLLLFIPVVIYLLVYKTHLNKNTI